MFAHHDLVAEANLAVYSVYSVLLHLQWRWKWNGRRARRTRPISPECSTLPTSVRQLHCIVYLISFNSSTEHSFPACDYNLYCRRDYCQ